MREIPDGWSNARTRPRKARSAKRSPTSTSRATASRLRSSPNIAARAPASSSKAASSSTSGKTRRPARSVRASASSSRTSPSSAARPRAAKRAVPLPVPVAATMPRLLPETRAAATTSRSQLSLPNLITQARSWHSPKSSSSSPSTA